MRSGALSGTKRPSRRLSSAISSSRPASIRVLHQAPPPVATRLTRSPSRTPVLRNWATAALALWPPARVRWMSSKRITNERPVCDSRSMLVDTRGRGAGFSEATAGSCTASKSVIVWRSSSSVTWKSLLVRPVTGRPFLSVTTTSTVTTSTPAGKDALDAVGGASGEAAGAGRGDWAAATVQAAPASRAIRDEVFFMTNHDFWHRRGEKSILTEGEWWGLIPSLPKTEVSLEFVEPSLLLLHEDVGENYDAVARSAAAAVGAETCH